MYNIIKTKIKISISYIKINGFKRFSRKVLQKISIKSLYLFHSQKKLYSLFIAKREPAAKELLLQTKTVFPFSPKISIICPVWNTPECFLKEMVQSVINQTYSNWELCLSDGKSANENIRKILNNYKDGDKRIKVKFLDKNMGIVGNSNEALKLAEGDYIGLLDHDDTLAPFALFEAVKAINKNHDADFIYSDEDKLSEDGKSRFSHNFKPDFSPDLLRSHNYICHFSIFKKELLNNIGFFNEGYEGSQDYDLILRASEKAKKIIHIPKVLYHWRISQNSTALWAGSKMYAYISAKKALEEHLKRIGLNGKVNDGLSSGLYDITYDINQNHLISIIIPNKDHKEDLERCVSSIMGKSTYRNFEIIIVENNSEHKSTFEFYDSLTSKYDKIKIINWNNKPFNYSSVNNYAAEFAKGDTFLFLNNDTEVINKDWMERMLEHVQRKEVGAAGAKLYYPDNTVQHGGVIIGLSDVAGHSHKGFSRNSCGYINRLCVIQNLSAVTGACFMVRKEVFEEVKGFDEDFVLGYGDVDICLKIRSKGYLVIWTPLSELYHYESITRGYEDTPEKRERINREIKLFHNKWRDILEEGDPYYNINLAKDKEDFSISV
jgi:GT2 family glycosyltransferase